MARDEPNVPNPADGAVRPFTPDPTHDVSRILGMRVGAYEPIVEIARGGMGAVFAARAHEGPAAGSVVALKLLRGDLIGSPRRAFIREARVTSRLDHPNVVHTIDAGDAEGEVFLAMELVVGVTLAQLLARLDARGVRTDPWAIGYVVACAARGLHAAHELVGEHGAPLRLVHRDVSPQNILLDFEGRVLVADFGIAKFAHDGTTTEDGTLKGKFSYMSPEQIRAEKLDRRADVFALGAVLYEGLTGDKAFGGRGPAEIVSQVLHGRPPDPRAVRPDIPEGLARVVLRCLATDREDRYPTAAGVADHLHAGLALAKGSPADVLATTLTAHFAPERARFGRLLGDAWGASARSAPERALDSIDDPTTLDSGNRAANPTLSSVARQGLAAASGAEHEPLRTSRVPSSPVEIVEPPSAVARWTRALRRGPPIVPAPRPSGATMPSAALPSRREMAGPRDGEPLSEAGLESKWPLRIGLVVGLLVVAALALTLLPDRSRRHGAAPASSGSATIEPIEPVSADASEQPAPSAPPSSNGSPRPTISATPAAPPSASEGSTPSPTRASGKRSGDVPARPPRPKPSATSSSGVFRDW